jgi:two-component system, OmpR family, sensor histidine kinase MprB
VSLRRRLMLACAAAVALAVVLAAGLTYWFVRDTLRDQIDASLSGAQRFEERVAHGQRAIMIERRSKALAAGQPPPVAAEKLQSISPLDGPVPFAQLSREDGTVVVPPGERPVDLVDREDVDAVARGEREPFFADVERGGVHLRVYTTATGAGDVLQVARPLDEVDGTLATLRVGLGVIVLLGIAAALGLARLATRAAVRPVSDLTDAAEHVTRTRDLTRRIEREGDDELSRLAGAFNTMLEALDESQRAQRRLVADASHELRTPLTSLRTNLEVLGRDGLGASDHARLRADVIAQLEELTLLVADLVDLAREEEPVAEREALRLDELVSAAVERAERHAPGVRFAADLEPCVVDGVRSRLDRAVANLLDNAAKYGGPGGTVEVTLRDGELTVRDHGPGIADEDLPFVFDRFYRAPAARGRPGSGLGLAIVRQAAEAHGGSVHADRAPDGGAVLRLALSPSS